MIWNDSQTMQSTNFCTFVMYNLATSKTGMNYVATKSETMA